MAVKYYAVKKERCQEYIIRGMNAKLKLMVFRVQNIKVLNQRKKLETISVIIVSRQV